MTNETKYVVISESDLLKLTKTAGVTYPTIPAQELWDAALIEMAARKTSGKYGREPKLMKDFLTSKLPNND